MPRKTQLTDDPRFATANGALDEANAEFRKLAHRRTVVEMAMQMRATDERPPANASPVHAEAQRLADDAAVDEADLAEELRRLVRELKPVARRLAAAREAREVAIDAISAEEAARQAPEHRRRLAAIFNACAALEAAMTAEREQRLALLAAGYRLPDHILPVRLPAAGIRLGSVADWGSDISEFRRQLEGIGALN